MNTWRLTWVVGGVVGVVLAGLFPGVPTSRAQDKNKLELDQVPKKVINTLKSKFPKAKIRKWSKEKEGGTIVYDFEFKQDGQKFEADIKEDGSIHNWEKEIAAKDLPKVVKKAVKAKYPKSKFKEVMVITAVKNNKDLLQGYEIVFRTADNRNLEVTVAPNGKILEVD